MTASAGRSLGGRRQPFVHDQGVHVAERGMPERLWQAACLFEAQALPQLHGALVACRDEIELHGLVAEFEGDLFGVPAHRGGESLAARRRIDHVAAIADMGARSVEVGFQIVSAEHLAVPLGNEGLARQMHPYPPGFFLAGIGGESVGIARGNDDSENRPYLLEILFAGFADYHAGQKFRRLKIVSGSHRTTAMMKRHQPGT